MTEVGVRVLGLLRVVELCFLGKVYPLLMKLNKNAAIILRARDPQAAQEQVFDIVKGLQGWDEGR